MSVPALSERAVPGAGATPLSGRVPGLSAQTRVVSTDDGAPGSRSQAQESDSVSISAEARAALTVEGAEENSKKLGARELTSEEQEQVRQLKARDREVRAHEMAHKAAAGSLATSGPSYQYQTSPDGKRYAVGGEVQVELKAGRTPEETLRNAQQVQRAALSPQDPSAQDRAVAASAAQQASAAQSEIKAGEAESDSSGRPGGVGSLSRPRIDTFA